MSSRSRVITTFLPDIPPPDKQSAAYKIFHHEWNVSVPHIFVYSEEFMRISGTVISGDASYDSRLPKQMVGGRYTIAQLAVLMDEGATIRLDVPQDAKAIYDIISRHLEDWSSLLNKTGSFDLKKAPENDLMLLSQLADTLYGYAARYFTNERPLGSLRRRFEQIRGRGARLGSGRRYVDPNAEKKPEEKAQMPNHSQFTENILAKGGGRNSWS